MPKVSASAASNRARVGLNAEALPDSLRVRPGSRPRLKGAAASENYGWNEDQAKRLLEINRESLGDLQNKLYADGRYPVLIVLQGTDCSGKDGTIRHVITAFNLQGCSVTSFKAPSAEESSHDYLWRIHRRLPARREIMVFNRSHYEDLIVPRVDGLVPKKLWQRRYEEINQFERMLSAQGMRIIKIFLHISKGEQKQRLESRLNHAHKQWKFEPADLEKRRQWHDYRKAFEAVLERCSTAWAPWYLIPADHEWFRNLAVSQILLQELAALPLRYPKLRIDPQKIRIR